MVVLLAVGGAVAMFAAGWVAGRARQPPEVVRSNPVAQPSDSLYADVLALHPMGVIVASPNGSVEYRNPAASAVGGTHVGVLIDEAVAKHLAAARSGGPSSETIELFGPPKRVIVVSAEPMPSGRSVAFVEDISDRRRAEQARTDFVANVSHELRTPIGALMALADTLEGIDDGDIVARVVSRMQGEADRASRIVEALLELSQIEAGAERHLEMVELVDIMNDAVGRVSELAARSGIDLATLDTAEAAEPLRVDGDRRQLASAVGNILENAVKYSERGDVVHVAVRRADDLGEIVVADEGAGIPRQDLDRVFERFYRVDRARSRRTGGTGLGLSIVRHVAQAHGGSISVDSVEGQGATFVLRLPLAIDMDETSVQAAEPATEREGIA